MKNAKLRVNPDASFIDYDIDTALHTFKTKPLEIQDLVEVLSTCLGENQSTESSSLDGMYPEEVVDEILNLELFQLFRNDWLDISIVQLVCDVSFYEPPVLINHHIFGGVVSCSCFSLLKSHPTVLFLLLYIF